MRKILVSLFSSNIPLYIEKNSVENLCKVLEMELKIHTPVSPNFVSEKIKFKVLYYIQHDFIRQRLGLSKDQTSMFKVLLLINYFDRWLWNTFKNTFWWRQYLIKGNKCFFYIKGDKYFFIIIVDAANVLLKLNYL